MEQMTSQMLAYLALPLGALALTLAVWGVLALVLGIPYKDKTPPQPVGALSAAALCDCTQDPSPAIRRAELRMKRGLAFLIATPLVTLSAYLLGLVANLLDEHGYTIYGLVVCGLLLWTAAFLIYKGARERFREAQWHESARAMVAQAVATLVERGHVVFKDFRTEHIAIDYLIVGPKGVFALQRMIQAAYGRSGSDAEPVVTYNGRALFFPHGREHLIIDWAQEQAERFSEWISQGMETPISARAILALPGWRIKRISADGISVINPAQMEALFQYVKPRPIPAEDMQAIIARIQSHYAAGWCAPKTQNESQPA